jgi:hypothetical protein
VLLVVGRGVVVSESGVEGSFGSGSGVEESVGVVSGSVGSDESVGSVGGLVGVVVLYSQSPLSNKHS